MTWVLTVVSDRIRKRLPTSNSTWLGLFSGGGLVASASFLFAGAGHLALAEGASHHLNPTALQALNALDINTSLAFTGGVAIMLLGAAATLSRRSDAIRMLGWIAIPLAIVNLTPAGVGAFPLTALWIVATAILISRRPDPYTSSAAAPSLAT